MKLSIIVPVYNVEPYVERCLHSLLAQDLPAEEYEIIVVNDGSPDNSRDIVLRMQEEADNILLIDQENRGVSAARNAGLGKARGEYVLFIDPDDYVLPDLLNRLYRRAKSDDLDILLSGRSLVTPEGKKIKKYDYSAQAEHIYTGTVAFYEKDKPYPVWDSSVGRLYRRDLLLKYNITYPVGVAHLEDGVFVRKAFVVAGRVGFENCDFYQVFARPGSASRSNLSTKESTVQGYFSAISILLGFRSSRDFTSSQEGILNTSIAKYALLPLMWSIQQKSLKSFIKFSRKLKETGAGKLDSRYIKVPRYRHGANVYNISPWLFGIWHILNMVKRKYGSENAVK